MLAILALPHVLNPYRQAHPIIRRSLVGFFVPRVKVGDVLVVAVEEKNTVIGSTEDADDAMVTTDENHQQSSESSSSSSERKLQELVFDVSSMTCGGCGSHVVRDTVEKELSTQQSSTSTTSFEIEKVQVDWKAGVLSIYGQGLVELEEGNTCGGVDKEAISRVLDEDGYPTKFLYAS
jgi:hypothetical protein